MKHKFSYKDEVIQRDKKLRNDLIKITNILNMKKVLEDTDINYQVYRNAKYNKFQHCSYFWLMDLRAAINKAIDDIDYIHY